MGLSPPVLYLSNFLRYRKGLLIICYSEVEFSGTYTSPSTRSVKVFVTFVLKFILILVISLRCVSWYHEFKFRLGSMPPRRQPVVDHAMDISAMQQQIETLTRAVDAMRL